MVNLRDEGNAEEKGTAGQGAGLAPSRCRARALMSRLPMRIALLVLLTLALGLGGGLLLGRHFPAPTAADRAKVSLPDSFTLPASYGNIGPALLAAGAIDQERFVKLYADAGQPLTEEQLAALRKGSSSPIVIDRHSARFLLNLLWAFGLTNQNAILQTGPMAQYGTEKIGSFASTAGWTMGVKPATSLYGSVRIVELTSEQQALVEQVATAVYRPCCGNPTSFPDCNHGMAMLGILELMASQGASEDDMFTAAKYVSAFWFPQQTLELATFLKATQGLDFAKADARLVVGEESFSGSGFQAVHQKLLTDGLLPQAPGGGNNCGV